MQLSQMQQPSHRNPFPKVENDRPLAPSVMALFQATAQVASPANHGGANGHSNPDMYDRSKFLNSIPSSPSIENRPSVLQVQQASSLTKPAPQQSPNFKWHEQQQQHQQQSLAEKAARNNMPNATHFFTGNQSFFANGSPMSGGLFGMNSLSSLGHDMMGGIDGGLSSGGSSYNLNLSSIGDPAGFMSSQSGGFIQQGSQGISNGSGFQTGSQGGFQQELHSPEILLSKHGKVIPETGSTGQLRQDSPNLLDSAALYSTRLAPAMSDQVNLDKLHISSPTLARMEASREGPDLPNKAAMASVTPLSSSQKRIRGSPFLTPIKTPEKPRKPENGFSIEVDSALTGPEEDIVVRWTAPKSIVSRYDWVGLYRVHQSEPESCMTSKSLNLNGAQTSEKTMHVDDVQAGSLEGVAVPGQDKTVSVEVLCGEMYFRAPPAIGRYDFRYYRDAVVERPKGGNRHDGKESRHTKGKGDGKDEGERRNPPHPHARSNMLTVEAQGVAFIDALRFLVKKIDSVSKTKAPPSGSKLREYAGACAQLVRLLEQLRIDWEGRPLTYAKQLWPVILHAVTLNFEITEKSTKSTLSRHERDISSISRTNRSLIAIAILNPAIHKLLRSEQVDQLKGWHIDLLRKEVQTVLTKQAENFGTKLNLLSESNRVAGAVPVFLKNASKSIIDSLTQDMNEIAPTFMPSAASQAQRQELFQRLDNMLQEDLYGLPGARGIKLAVFGSSANGFGSSSSDMDMCLNFNETIGGDADNSWMDPRELVLRIAELLKARGLQDVDTSRVTARIPVVQFIDPVTGLDCDICVNNHLALRNTKLLKSYSLCDPRVKIIAYIIKVWSKRRDLNDPKNSTLSSYGFLLTIFMHMQRRPQGQVS